MKIACIAATALVMVSTVAPAQNYRTRAVRIVTSPAGGGNDFLARLVRKRR